MTRRSAAFLRALIAKRMITQRSVAREAGCHEAFLCDLLRERRILRPEMAERIAAAIDRLAPPKRQASSPAVHVH